MMYILSNMRNSTNFIRKKWEGNFLPIRTDFSCIMLYHIVIETVYVCKVQANVFRYIFIVFLVMIFYEH
jgi:hypothetical protein